MQQTRRILCVVAALALLCACGAKASARLAGTWVMDEAATSEYLSGLDLDQASQQGLSITLPLLAGLSLDFNTEQKILTMSLFGHQSVTSYGVRDDSKDTVVVTDPAGEGADMEITFLGEGKIALSSPELGILVLTKTDS